MPGQHDPVNEGCEDERHIPPFCYLREVGHEEARIDDHKGAGYSAGRCDAPPPHLAHGDEEERGREEHRGRDSDAVGGGEVVGLAETDREPEGHQHQQPIDAADVDLAVACGRSLRDMEPRHPTQLDRLPGH